MNEYIIETYIEEKVKMVQVLARLGLIDGTMFMSPDGCMELYIKQVVPCDS